MGLIEFDRIDLICSVSMGQRGRGRGHDGNFGGKIRVNLLVGRNNGVHQNQKNDIKEPRRQMLP